MELSHIGSLFYMFNFQIDCAFFRLAHNDSTMCAQNAQRCHGAKNCLRVAHRAVLCVWRIFLKLFTFKNINIMGSYKKIQKKEKSLFIKPLHDSDLLEERTCQIGVKIMVNERDIILDKNELREVIEYLIRLL